MKALKVFYWSLPVMLIGGALALADGLGVESYDGIQESLAPTGPLGPNLQFTDGAGNSFWWCGSGNTWGFSNSSCTPGAGGSVRVAALKGMSGANILLDFNGASNGLLMASGTEVTWTNSSTSAAGTQDTSLIRAGAGLVQPSNGAGGAGLFNMVETTTPSAAAADQAKIYAKDNGGKTQLCAIFSSGAEQCFATQP